MKKKLLLIIAMFMFITNVNALTFNIDITNIEDKGNGGTIGSIENIDVANKELDVLFQDIGDEVNFEITVTNTGDRAGTLRNITFESSNDKIEYTSNLPAGGLAINGNDTNKVTITAKVLAGATNGNTTSNVKLKYTYDEGSCPEGETLSPDESQCLCPEGKVRNEQGICVEPEKPVECKADEIYNEQKKICEKKVVPPSNPKTLDNIILITLLFIVSGLGIYAVMFKKLKTSKQKKVVGVVTGVITLTLSFVTLTSIFGLDNLLGAIINPITKEKELIVKVNEEIDLIETWDGECSLDVADLTPSNIFQDGTGTQADPYQIKTAEQLSCFAKSVNNGTTYEGQYIKQTKHIKLNDHLLDQRTAGDLSNAHVWISAGYDNNSSAIRTFDGTYDGDNHIISGLYITNDSVPATSSPYGSYKGLFGDTKNATIKNIVLSDVYLNTSGNVGALIGCSHNNLTVDNVTTYGKGDFTGSWGSGVLSYHEGNSDNLFKMENTTNNIDLNCTGVCSGLVKEVYVRGNTQLTDYNIIFKNDTNNGNITYNTRFSAGSTLIGDVSAYGKLLIDNCANNGDVTLVAGSEQSYRFGGIMGYNTSPATITNTYNTGDITYTGNYKIPAMGSFAGVIGWSDADTVIDNVYNSGNILAGDYMPGDTGPFYSSVSYGAGILGCGNNYKITITNSFNTGDITIANAHVSGIMPSNVGGNQSLIENCYNTGIIKGLAQVGGITSEYPGTINKCYNTGDIYIISTNGGGLVGYSQGTTITNSYNEGKIYPINPSLNSNYGGLCSGECTITNSYNRGDIIASGDGCSQLGGLVGWEYRKTVTNSYNSGNITCQSTKRAQVGGINGSGAATNVYNLGNISVDQTNTYGSYTISGIGTENINNSVNTGNITLKLNTPFTSQQTISISGIGGDSNIYLVKNSFNSGTITLDDSDLPTPVRDDSLGHIVYVGEIQSLYNSNSSNNKFRNASGFALGCYQRGECTLEESNAVGISTEDSEPSILSIINGDDAFEIKSGETLPTLKVFNQ